MFLKFWLGMAVLLGMIKLIDGLLLFSRKMPFLMVQYKSFSSPFDFY